MALPPWVRGRGLPIYVAVMFGAMSLGSAIWGKAATITGVPIACMIAAAGAALGARFAPADLQVDEASRRLAIVARDGLGTLFTVAEALRADGIGVADISLRQPSLDEAFLALTAGTTAMTRAEAR